MNRNIITHADAAAWKAESENLQPAEDSSVATGEQIDFDELEKGGPKKAKPADVAAKVHALKSPKAPTPDEWQDRLLKFIPLEAVGLYLGIDAALRSAQLATITERRVWFGLALGVTLLFTWIYLRRKAKVSRVSQLTASLAAVLVWVFAMGGIFATFAFYKPWQGTVLLGVGTYFLSVLQLEPLAKAR